MVNKLSEKHECPFDVHLNRFIDTHLHLYYKLGFSPNMVTTLSILFGILSAYQILIGQMILAAISMLVAYYLDCVDGKLARKYNMISKFGDYYDHFGDFFKIFIIIYALIKSNKSSKLTDHQWMFIIMLSTIMMVQCVHMGYQETIYDKKHESSFLNVFRQIVMFDAFPHKTIQITKYCGCGSLMVCFAILIIFWHK